MRSLIAAIIGIAIAFLVLPNEKRIVDAARQYLHAPTEASYVHASDKRKISKPSAVHRFSPEVISVAIREAADVKSEIAQVNAMPAPPHLDDPTLSGSLPDSDSGYSPPTLDATQNRRPYELKGDDEMKSCIAAQLGIDEQTASELVNEGRTYYRAEKLLGSGAGPATTGLSPAMYMQLTYAGLLCIVQRPDAGSTMPSTPNIADGEMSQPDSTSGPILLRKVVPGYSEQARRANFNGTIYASVVIDTDGTVSHIRFPANERLYGLRDNIVNAISYWRFRPAFKNGVPVATTANLTFTFQRQ